jgi:hypothetical protein
MFNHYSTKIVLQMTDDPTVYIPVSKNFVVYNGPWELCGGGSSDPTQVEEEQSQANFDNTLQSIFTQQYATQQSQLNYLKNQLQPQLAQGGQGYTPAQLAAQRTSASDTNATQFQNAQAALNNQETQASGGSKLTGVSGANTEAEAGLLNAEAQTEAGSQNQITTNNANLQQSNYWNAINALNGVAAEQNPLGYSSAATNAASASASNANANTNHITATNSLGSVLGALGGAAGAAGTAIGGIYCHIFASFFGWDDIRTYVMRMWLLTEAPKWFRNLYIKHSESISKTFFRWAFRPIATFVLAQVN